MGKIRVTTAENLEDRKAVEEEVGKDLQAFEEWFRTRGNEPLARPERAIIKTYLYWKLFEEKKDGTQASR